MQTPVNAANGFAHPPRNVSILGIEPGMKVADFGSGSGAYALLIAHELRGSGKLFAVDVQQDLLKRLKNEAHHQGYDNVEVLWGDLEKPRGSKIADRSLDLVLISNLLFQVEDIDALFKEAHRTLKKHGRLAIIDWSERSGSAQIGPHRSAIVSKEKAVERASACGFEKARGFDAGTHHYGLIMHAKATV
jgi:ubiquinone/menaquinone biosynthesis C-methylase UbiE